MHEGMANTFKNLVARNAINMHNPIALSSVIVHSQDEAEIGAEIRKLLKGVGV